MKLRNQESALKELKLSAENFRHNILIEGAEGVGKSYLAKQYAKMLNIDDFQIIESKVSTIREMIEGCAALTTPIVLCIENLDTGVASASYALLKFLEEPSPNVFIVVTCRNINHLPDTIASRSAVITVTHNSESDLTEYARTKNGGQFQKIKNTPIWKTAKSVKDVGLLLDMTLPQIEHIKSAVDGLNTKDSVSSMIWKFCKYPDGTPIPLELLIKYIMVTAKSSAIRKSAHECINALTFGRISSRAVLAKFLFEYKYAMN